MPGGQCHCVALEQKIAELSRELEASRRNHKGVLQQFQARGKELNLQLGLQRQVNRDLELRNRQLIGRISDIQNGGLLHSSRKDLQERLAPRITSQVVRSLNIRLSSEFEVLHYSVFSKELLYQLEPGLSGKPELNPVGDRKREKDEVTHFALDMLNFNLSKGQKYTANDLFYAHSRMDRTIGSHYELFFTNHGSDHMYHHFTVFRPFASLQLVEAESFNKGMTLVNIVVPLSGRLNTFKQFLSFVMPKTVDDQYMYLTVVYFGEEGRDEAKALLRFAASEHNFDQYMFIAKEGNFSRGAALLAGAEAWNDGNVLLFFCDVDIYFYPKFLDHCRLNTAPNSKIYYPIVFSLFNPDLVYHSTPVPKLEHQLTISQETGFWRSFGFGMACMYRSDFLFHKGFGANIEGWGGEDVSLYRRIVASSAEVVRAPDPAIFHIWHEKHCNSNLSQKQYVMCVGSKLKADVHTNQLGD